MIRAAFVIPGDITLPTGGYAYDRRVLALLAGQGVDCTHVVLPGSYPAPTPEDLAETERTLAALPADTVLLIDGLAFGAMSGDVVRRIKQKIVALVHHPLALEAGLSPMRQRSLRQTETMALAFAQHVLVTSPETGRILVADFAVADARLTVAEPGTDRAPRAKGSGGFGPVHLLAVGSIVPRKGYDVLATALGHMSRDRDLNWHLTIVGAVRDAAARASLDTRLKGGVGSHDDVTSRVDIIGAVDDATLSTLYDRTDIFVMPSLYEGYGMVLTEALVRGLPVVCTDGVAAVRTLPEQTTIVVPAGHSGELEGALRDLIAKPGLRTRLSEAAWAAGQKLPTWDDTARTVATVLKRVAA